MYYLKKKKKIDITFYENTQCSRPMVQQPRAKFTSHTKDLKIFYCEKNRDNIWISLMGK